MQPITLLIATADQLVCEFLAHQLDADGHTIHLLDSPEQTTGKLAAHAIDVVLLSDFDSAADAPALLRSLRAGQLHTRALPRTARRNDRRRFGACDRARLRGRKRAKNEACYPEQFWREALGVGPPGPLDSRYRRIAGDLAAVAA
jgi:CheY-like chemotaxis protein